MPLVEERGKGRYEVVAPVSSVRIGETRKDFVRSKACVDYPRWVALFVSKSERDQLAVCLNVLDNSCMMTAQHIARVPKAR